MMEVSCPLTTQIFLTSPELLVGAPLSFLSRKSSRFVVCGLLSKKKLHIMSSYNNRNRNYPPRRGGGGRNRVDISQLPLEQGVICSLRDSFGFIHCAERPIELFFHYSQVENCHPDDLMIDTEVEFRVGTSKNDSTKLAAYQVVTVPNGTIVWETEDEPDTFFQGLVERPARSDLRGNRGGSDVEGTIRVLVEETAAEDEATPPPESSPSPTGPLLRYRNEDYNPDSNRRRTNRLYRGDLVKFRILTDRRTKQKYARYYEILQTEKERAKIEKERKLLESATEEEGVVVSLNNGFGFIKSNKRRAHVYFHYSHLIIPEDDETGEDFELKKGQELKFLVVTEKADGEDKVSARNLQCLPKGSVVFSMVVARGVKGIVEVCPRPPIGSDDKYGTVRLLDPIADGDNSIKSVFLEFSDSPGVAYANDRKSSQTMGLWIESGDTILFDIVKEVVDGSYRASPTRHTLGPGGVVEEPNEEGNSGTPVIHLVAASLVHRAEGVVQTVKADYGFIQFSERLIDVHFKTFNFFPEEIQSDLRKQLGYDGKAVKLEAGASVQFDICAQGTVSHQGRRQRRRGGNSERENIKGHRMLLLPPQTVIMEKIIKKEAKGVIKSVDLKQPYAGFIDLEEEITPMPLEERHTLVAQMIRSFLEETKKPNGRSTLVFRDLLNIKDDEVVVEMVNAISDGMLQTSHIPVAGAEPHPGRLCIKAIVEDSEEANDKDDTTGTDTVTKKKRGKKDKKFTSMHFDKSSLSAELKDDVPPGVGDTITYDIIQSRRTGLCLIQNMKIVERNESNENGQIEVSAEASGLGIVKDVVPKSNFGFIHVLDEAATKREVLFFHLSSDKNNKKSMFRKGDEVKFDIVLERGKRTAINVEVLPRGTIPGKAAKNACLGYILMEPSHTSLSDTPLRQKFSQMSTGEKSGGRWNDVKDDSQRKKSAGTHEEGCILLLEDKSGMFSKKRRRAKDKGPGIEEDDTKSVEDSGSQDDLVSVDSTDKSIESIDSIDGDRGLDDVHFACKRLPYKNGAIAIHGDGSSSSIDGSSNPRRGDLVSFVKARKNTAVRDVRLVTRRAAKFVQGRLENIERLDSPKNLGTAKFISATEKEEEYEVDLKEVISCDVSTLKEKESVEAILHEGKLYGICRTADLYLESKLGTKNKERPKLNLSVKKNRGGKIMAQSMMAKVCNVGE